MKIANVIYERELVNHTQVEYVNYYKEAIEYEKLDKTLPTLYVGWSFMKACNSNNEIIQNADILRKKIITNELYWEFSFEESKPSHVKGIESFVKYAPLFYFQPKYQYICLDPVFFQIVDIQGLIDILPKEIDVTYNFKNEMLYVLKDSKISGIDLKMYSYFQFNTNEIIFNLHNKTINWYDDIESNLYQSYYKLFPNFMYLKRYMVIILKQKYFL